MGRAVGLHIPEVGEAKWVPVKVDEDGRVVFVEEGEAGASPGDATSAKQDAQTTKLEEMRVLLASLSAGDAGDATAAGQTANTAKLEEMRVQLAALIAAQGKLPLAASSAVVEATTSGTAGTFVAFGAQAATHLDVLNNSGVTIRLRKVGTVPYIRVADGQGYMMFPITNANQVEASLDVTGTAAALRAMSYVG